VTVLVRAEAGDGACALPIAAVRAVVPAGGLRPLPSAAPGVAGLLDHGGGAVPVLAVLTDSGDHVLVLEEGGERFGLLVGRVTGVVRLRPGEVGPAPGGQAQPLVRGIVRRAGAEALVLDPAVLRGRLAGGVHFTK
jgi:chemotaxis signal transduction protein